MILRQIAFDVRTWWRNGEQLLLMVVLPITALIVGPSVIDRFDITLQQLADGILIVAYFATAFTGQAILTAFDRRSNALLVIGAGPMGRRGFVLARIGAVLVGCMIQAVFLTAAAGLRGFDVRTTAIHAVIALTGVPAYVASGLLLAGILPAELVLGIANLLFVGGAMFGGAFNGIAWSPLGAVRELLTVGPGVVPLVTLLLWTAVSGVTAIRTFRWVD